MKPSRFFLLFTIAGALASEGAGAPRSAPIPQASAKKPPASATEAAYRAAADSADAKFRHIETNGKRSKPDQTPTVFTQREINAYMADDRIELPKGVKRVRFSGSQGVVTTDATVDFDQITAGARNSNPLLALFSGVHEVEVVSHAQASGGEGRVHIDSVSIDGVGVPRIALEFFANKYIKPRYPNLGLDSQFRLPDRVDTATVGDHTLIVTQK
jgi:hypothetical protein